MKLIWREVNDGCWYGYKNKIVLFVLEYDGLKSEPTKNNYKLASLLPQMKDQYLTSFEEGQQKAEELLDLFIDLMTE